jgi:A nuclease family of the HNH/ENDO VII superfamily with conserved AHH
MTLERIKKPSNVALGSGKPKRADQAQIPGQKSVFVPMTPEQLQRARERFDQGMAQLQHLPNNTQPMSQESLESSTTDETLDPSVQIPQTPITTEAQVVSDQKPAPKPSTPPKVPPKPQAAKPDTKLKLRKMPRLQANTRKLPAAIIKKPTTPKANKLEFQADIKPTKISAPTALKTNVNTRNIEFAPIPNLEKIDPSEKAKLLKQQAASTKAANSTIQNLRKQAQSLEPHGVKLSAQITKAASAAKGLVTQAGSQQKALVNTQISALIAQARSKGQASISKNNSDAKVKIAALPGITNTAKQAITTSHQQQTQALKTKLESQKALIRAKYDANKSHYETAGQTAGGAAKTVASAKAETWHGQKTHESWWDKTKSYADFGAGPHPNDVLDAKADADIQTGDGYAGAEGYPGQALKAFEESKQGIEHDFENFKTEIHDPLKKGLGSQKDNAIKQLQSSETSTKQQIEQTRAQMESAMKAQLDGVLQKLTGQKTSLVATIDAIIKQSTSGIEAQSSAQIKGLQTALRTAATGIQGGISALETQMSGKNAPKPEVLKRMLEQIEHSIASTVKQTLAQTSRSASASSTEYNSLAKTSIEKMHSSTQQGVQSAKQSEQQLIQSLGQLVQSAAIAYTKFQQTHKTTTAKTQADTIAEFTKILTSSDTAFQTALEQLAKNLETAATAYGAALVTHANGPDFQAALTKAEAEAAAKVQPRWKGLLKILLLIVVIVVIALVVGPAVIGAVGAFATALGAGAAAGAIGVIVGGAIVGALSGAVIQIGNNAIDGNALFDGVGEAMLVGAISGAIGGGLGYAFSSGANVVAANSNTLLSAIGNKASSFGGKMLLDQVNGVVSSQFSSLLTSGKFQDFGAMLKDPSMWIGVAVSAASHSGGPRMGVNGEVVRPANRLEIIQERAFGAGERFGQDLGVRTAQGLGSQPNIEVKTNTNLEPEQQRINTKEGVAKVEVGQNSHPEDVRVHQDVAAQHILENGPIAKLKQRLGIAEANEAPPGTKASQLQTEALKHEAMADWRFAESERQAKLGNKPQADRLRQEAHDLREASHDYLEQSRDVNARNQPGDGEIDGGKRIYDNHDDVKDLLGKQFDKTKVPDGYTTFEIEGGRKIVAKVSADGTIDIKKAVLLVNEKGNVSVNAQSRVSYDYIKIYENSPNARSGISFGKDGYTIHHMITDKISTGHPLTVKAMELIGFNVDMPANYAAMPMKDQFFKLDGAEVGHWSSHPDFDTRVYRELNDIQIDLEVKYGEISGWSTHSDRVKLAAELKQNILNLQNDIFEKIKTGQVPMTNEGTSTGFGRIN